MHLYGGFGGADVGGNLFVQTTGRDPDHALTLAGAERVEALPDHIQCFLALPPRTIAREAGLDGVEQVLLAERFGEELDGPSLHRLHRHRDVAVRRNEDDRQFPVRRRKGALQIETAATRHSPAAPPE